MTTKDGAVLPLQPEFAKRLAQEWIEAWNRHDAERILSHYADEVVLISPVARAAFGGDGAVRGKAALREYFIRGLQAYPDLRFDWIETLWGIETVIVHYFNNVRGGKAAEMMQLDSAGLVTRVWAHYDR